MRTSGRAAGQAKKTSHDHVYLGHRWSPKLENSIWHNIKHESWFGRGVLGERRKTMKRTNLEFGMIPNWQLLTGSDPQVYLNSLLWAQWRKVSRGGEMSSNIRHALAQHFPILLAGIEGWSHIPKHTRHTYLSFYMAMGASCAQVRSRNGPKSGQIIASQVFKRSWFVKQVRTPKRHK
jgi:hypothetical protein